MSVPFEFELPSDVAAAHGLRRLDSRKIVSGDIVRAVDGRDARFVCVDMSGPHHAVWLSFNGCGEYFRMLRNAHEANRAVTEAVSRCG